MKNKYIYFIKDVIFVILAASLIAFVLIKTHFEPTSLQEKDGVNIILVPNGNGVIPVIF